MADITTLEDCRRLVDIFYAEVREDPALGPIFAAKVKHWPTHLDTMARFWFTVLFGEDAYHGNPLVKHVPLPIDRTHFDRWLAIWTRTVDAHFEGPIAASAKDRALRMAGVLESRVRATTGRPIA